MTPISRHHCAQRSWCFWITFRHWILPYEAQSTSLDVDFKRRWLARGFYSLYFLNCRATWLAICPWLNDNKIHAAAATVTASTQNLIWFVVQLQHLAVYPRKTNRLRQWKRFQCFLTDMASPRHSLPELAISTRFWLLSTRFNEHTFWLHARGKLMHILIYCVFIFAAAIILPINKPLFIECNMIK